MVETYINIADLGDEREDPQDFDITTEVSESSTDEEVPTAKAVYEFFKANAMTREEILEIIKSENLSFIINQ